MGNKAFIDKFSQAHAIFQPYLISDHCPNIIIIPKVCKPKKRAFKFVNFVAEKEEFTPIVQKHWMKNYNGCHMFNTVKKLKDMKTDLRKLTWKDGNIFDKVKSLKSQLQEVQSKIDKNPHDKNLKEEENHYIQAYVDAMKEEESLLFHKAKIKWLKVGDRNNAYLHKVLKKQKP
ncbi:hypothetical protein Tco_1138221 [Tanacetum coccineum]